MEQFRTPDSSKSQADGWMIPGRWGATSLINGVTLPETNSSHLKIDPWKRIFLLEPTIFRCELLVSGRVLPLLSWHYNWVTGVISLYGLAADFYPRLSQLRPIFFPHRLSPQALTAAWQVATAEAKVCWNTKEMGGEIAISIGRKLL